MSARVAALALVCALAACGGRSQSDIAADSMEAATRMSRVTAAVANQGLNGDGPFAKWILPPELAEVSGIALASDGRIFAHGDEQGRIAIIDYRTGVFLKRFKVGERTINGDFEAVTIVGQDVYLLQSNGKIYQFREPAGDERAAFTLHDTELGDKCEFEGIAHDPRLDVFLLACKQRGKKPLDSLTVYRWRLGSTGVEGVSVLSIPNDLVIGANDWKELHPSDIAVDPVTGNYVLVARQERALIIITPEGDVVESRPVPGKILNPEGVAITRDGILLISDEAAKEPASISLFRWRAKAPPAGADTSSMPIDSASTMPDSIRP